MKIDANQIATITVEELHDMLASFDFTVPEEGGHCRPSEIKVEGENADNPTIQSIVAHLNICLEHLRMLDSDFHNEFDGSYC